MRQLGHHPDEVTIDGVTVAKQAPPCRPRPPHTAGRRPDTATTPYPGPPNRTHPRCPSNWASWPEAFWSKRRRPAPPTSASASQAPASTGPRPGRCRSNPSSHSHRRNSTRSPKTSSRRWSTPDRARTDSGNNSYRGPANSGSAPPETASCHSPATAQSFRRSSSSPEMDGLPYGQGPNIFVHGNPVRITGPKDQ